MAALGSIFNCCEESEIDIINDDGNCTCHAVCTCNSEKVDEDGSNVEKTTAYIIKKAKENKLKVIINSGLNGVLSNYQRKWVVKNIHSATISLDGDKEIQNMLRPLKNGQTSFDIVHNTLKYFDSQDFNYAIRSTVTSETIGKLEKIITFFL